MPRTNYAKRMKQEAELESKAVVDEEDIEETKTSKVIPAKKKFDSEDGIECRSVTVGGLSLSGVKSGDHYRWTEYGDITEVEYRDLAAMVRSKSPYLFNPYFVIDDEDFIENFPLLKQFYDESYTVNDLKQVLRLPVSQIKSVLSTLPNGAKETLKSIASSQIASGELDSVKVIKTLDEYFGTELNLLASMFV